MPKKKKEDNPFQWLARKAHELLKGEAAYISKEEAKKIQARTIKGGGPKEYVRVAGAKKVAEAEKAEAKAKAKVKAKAKAKPTAAELLTSYGKRTGKPKGKR